MATPNTDESELSSSEEIDAPLPTTKRKGGGAQLNRSETVTVRLDPKLRYLAELASRKQRRTLSSFIEWAIEVSLSTIILTEFAHADSNLSISDEAARLWDVDEPDRFIKLAVRYPDLLTHGEQVLWKLIRENGYLWRGHFDKVSREWTWKPDEDSMVFEHLRRAWQTFSDVANGKCGREALPTWVRKKNPEISTKASTKFDDDDIPF